MSFRLSAICTKLPKIASPPWLTYFATSPLQLLDLGVGERRPCLSTASGRVIGVTLLFDQTPCRSGWPSGVRGTFQAPRAPAHAAGCRPPRAREAHVDLIIRRGRAFDAPRQVFSQPAHPSSVPQSSRAPADLSASRLTKSARRSELDAAQVLPDSDASQGRSARR